MPEESPSEKKEQRGRSFRISRRGFLKIGAAAAAAGGIAAAAGPLQSSLSPQPASFEAPVTWKVISIKLNGQMREFRVKANWTLADFLRSGLGMTGTKVGCNLSSCGACTVLLDDKPIYSCQRLAIETDGHELMTIEGLGSPALHPVQQGFITAGSPQCGYCIPGQVMTAAALLSRNPNPTRDQIRRALAGNICRCANYVKIVDGVVEGARILGGGP